MRVMLASEQFQQVVVPRLHAQTDPIDSEFLQNGRLSRGNAAGICFNGPLGQLREVEPFVKAAQQHFQLRNVQRRRRAAAKIDGRWTNGSVGALRRPPNAFGRARHPCQTPKFTEYRLTKSPCLRAIEQILVKSAIRTDARTEGNVNVDVTDHDRTASDARCAHASSTSFSLAEVR